MKIAVLGAGVVGMSTAIRVQQCLPKAVITLIAGDFNTNTLSHVAAGQFLPFLQSSPHTPLNKMRKWTADSSMYYKELHNSGDSHNAGISIVSCYEMFDEDQAPPLFCSQFLLDTRRMTKDELAMFSSAKIRSGYFCTTFMIECTFYLPYMLDKFVGCGGVVLEKYIGSFDELVGYDMVFNCTGLGSKKLCVDETLHPVRGQISRVSAPWVKHGFGHSDGSYVLPGRDFVVLGGVEQAYNWNREISDTDATHIRKTCEQMLPSLRHATPLQQLCGLRPYRATGIRVEFEQIKVANVAEGQPSTINIVHNYGHGGNGVSLSYGTAVEAVNLAMDHLTNLNFSLSL